MTTRISLDVTAVPPKPAGAGRYVVEVARRLATSNDVDLQIVSRRNDTERWRKLRGRYDVHNVAPSLRPLRLAWEQLWLPTVLKRIGPAVHFSPHYTMPEHSKVPSIVTIHDMTFFDHPEWHERVKVSLFRRAVEVAAERAEALIAVSHYTARELARRFGNLDVTVIPHGVDHRRFTPRTEAIVEHDLRVLQRHGIHPPFICFVGTVEPRKNVPSLLRAFERLAASDRSIQLVIAGQPGWGTKAVDETIAGMRARSRVIRPGFLPDPAIPALLRCAEAVAYPSLVEGFGLPALEALSCGAALVTTTGSAMEEVVDNAALLIPPGDDVALYDALRALVNGGAERDELCSRGPGVAAQYTWDASAAAHVELAQRVAARRR